MGFVQIGVMLMRDPVTREPTGEKIKLYGQTLEDDGKVEEVYDPEIVNNHDAAGLFADRFKAYMNDYRAKMRELKKKQDAEAMERGEPNGNSK